MHSGQNVESEKNIFGFKFRDLTGKQWIIVLLIGLLLAVAAWPTPDKTTNIHSMVDNKESKKEYVEYSQLEKKVETLLECVEGVGDVSVLLMTGQEEKEQNFYSSGEMTISGVLIAAEGADQPVIVQNIQQAVMALFQIEAHKIKIMKMK